MLNKTIRFVGQVFQKLRKLGVTKNEFIVIKGVRYPVNEILGYSQEKLHDILLRQSAATPEEYKQVLSFLDGLRSTKINRN